MAADGTLKIDTTIDDSGIKVGARDVEAAAKRMASSVDRAGKAVANYSKEAMQFMDEWSKLSDADKTNDMRNQLYEAAKAGQSLDSELKDSAESGNQMRKELESARRAMDDLAGKGLWYGDAEFDEAAKQYARITRAVKDYEKTIAQMASKEYEKDLFEISPKTQNPFGLDTISGKVLELQIKLKELVETGRGLGDPAYDEIYRKLALAKDAAKQYAAELAKTPAQAQKEADAQAKKEAAAKKAAEAEALRAAKAEQAWQDQQRAAEKALAREVQAIMKAEEAEAQRAAKAEQAWQKEQQQIEQVIAKEVQAAMEAEKLKAIGDSAEVSSPKIVALRKELDELIARQQLLSKAGLGYGYKEYDALAQKIAKINRQLSGYAQQAQGSNAITKLLNNAFKKLVAPAKKAFSKIAGGAKKAVKSMLGLNKSANKCRMTMGRMLASSILFSTVFRGLSAITGGFKEGLQNLAQYSNATNKDLSMLKSSLTQLKNSFATAFAPILSVVAPMLTSFINLISRAVTYVGMFIAALTGKSTFTKATSVQEDYAASLKDTAGAAKDAEKALEDYTSPLDDINKMEDKSSSGGGGYTAPTPGEMFEEVPIAGGLADLANQIKDMIKAQDWDGLGGLVAEKLNGVVDKIGNAISWEKVGGKVTKFTTGLTTFFNALVRDFDWPGLGNTIGSGINTIIYTLDQLITGVDWITLGASFAAGLMGIFTRVDWPALGKLIGDKFMIAWRTFYGFVTNLDYVQLGVSIGQAINGAIHSIDLGMMFEALSTFVIGLLQTLITVIQTTDWHAVGQQVAAALMAIDWLGLAGGLFEAGASLIDGLLQAFGELPLPVQLAAAAVGVFFTAFKVTSLIQGVIKLLDGAGGLTSAIKAVSKALGGPWTLAITAAIAIIGLLIANWDDVKATMQKFDKWLSGVFSTDWSKQFGILGDVMNGLFAGLKQTWDGIKRIFTGIIDFVTGVFSGDWKKAWGGIKDIFGGIWDSLVGIIKTPINAIIGLINGLVKGVCSGLNGCIKALNKLSFDVPDFLVPILGEKFGFNIKTITAPQIPYLAKGAVIPPNAPFMAVLGDQRQGTNIEAPEGLIRRIIREEMGGADGSGEKVYHIQIFMNRKVVYEEFIKEAQLRQKQTGRNPLELA